MNKKLITIFLVFTILPVALITWLGAVSIGSERDRSRRQQSAAAYERLELIQLRIENYFENLENRLLAMPSFSASTPEEIREFTRKDPYVRQIFVFDTDGSLRYPSEVIPLSARETDFLERTREIGLSPGLFHDTGEAAVPRTGEKTGGWYTWYLGEGINFIFWRNAAGPSGPDIIEGIELNRMALLSGIINALPATEQPDGDFRIVLEDISGSIVYQWGGYTPPEEYSGAEISLPAPEPVSAWRLKFLSGPGETGISPARKAALAAPFAALILAVIGLAVFLYRESTRESREALQKVSFVNQVSHELKTPLTNIRMYAELLEERIPEDDPASVRYLDVVVSESRRLSRLITNVLTFGKEQKNSLSLNPAPADPDGVVRNVAGAFVPALEAKEVVVELSLNGEGTAVIDPDILEQIVSNLISNAEKYAASGGYIGISTFREDEAFVLIVRDRGPGIPAAAREKVFRPFFRLSSKLTDTAAGTGIGLYIVRNLAQLHKGSAAVLSSSEGACFEVRLYAPRAEDGTREEQHENPDS